MDLRAGVNLVCGLLGDGSPGLAADITAASATDLRLGPGQRVAFTVKARKVSIHRAR
ncbi:TOBE domain-containing protein [Mycolicibacterium hodleri]|uniref:TOBE domain-containing protein n=1 Tax=Mycolicibacterium hodleri TaxID=49897 RepID=UPI0027E25DB1|nr:TOBE domain-containing protein [Mycolicibacterium hodleri]